jgi:hypothetical protein
MSITDNLFDLSFEAHGSRIKSLLEKDDIWSLKSLNLQIIKRRKWIINEGKCCFCGEKTYLDSDVHDDELLIATLEHIICKEFGGSNDPKNLEISCYKCNNLRQSMDFEKFDELIKTLGKDQVHQMFKIENKIERRLKFEFDIKFRNRVIKQIMKTPLETRTKTMNSFGFYGDSIEKELMPLLENFSYPS